MKFRLSCEKRAWKIHIENLQILSNLGIKCRIGQNVCKIVENCFEAVLAEAFYLRIPMRYFLTLAYLGSRYAGWQVQPNAPSVQSALETALSTILQENIEITGCGRTDAGVHASYYVAHFDTEKTLPSGLLNGLNSLLAADISVFSCVPVHEGAHARYDAFERSYAYYITLRKDPFATDTAWHYPMFRLIEQEKMQELGNLLLQFDAFLPFCKTDSGLEHYRCTLKRAEWAFEPEQHRWIFHISANRFLRGMVRLIVGACIQVGRGQLSVDEVREALEQQKPLKKSLSVPPQGLFLTDVKYPFELKDNTIA